MRKKTFLLSVLFLAVALVKVNYFFNDGFHVHKVYSYYPYRPQWETEALPLQGDLKEIFSRNFTYLGKGRQAYVFESYDKNYVLKFVRHGKYRIPFWARFFSFCPFLGAYGEKVTAEKQARFFRAMNSYALAFGALKEETGILYMHLQPTDCKIGSVTAQDRLGRKFSIPLDKTAFILQRKVQPLIPVLEELYRGGKEEAIRNIFSSFLHMARQRTQKGIVNRDFLNCMRNCGYCQGKTIEIDVGSFYKKEGIDQSPALQREIANFSLPLQEFIQKRMPEMAAIFAQELRKELNGCEELPRQKAL